jgi:hypothetical protein
VDIVDKELEAANQNALAARRIEQALVASEEQEV